MPEWEIHFYRTSQEESPVLDFIYALESKTQSKVFNTIELLRGYGIQTGSPHIKKFTGTELWELRILGTDNIRIFYVALTGRKFILLHGFKKKKNKTSPREVRIAKQRLQDHKLRYKQK